jgi:G3E family GTPase
MPSQLHEDHDDHDGDDEQEHGHHHGQENHGHDGHGEPGEPDHDEKGGHRHYHDEKVRSFSIVENRPLDLKKTEAWISEMLGSMGANLYRSKGILHIQGEPKRIVFQGVQMMFEAVPERFWRPDEKRQTRMVFIGKELDEARIRAGFESCLAGA